MTKKRKSSTNNWTYILGYLGLAIFLAGTTYGLYSFTAKSQSQDKAPKKIHKKQQKDPVESLMPEASEVQPLNIPASIDFAGEQVPFYDTEVQERFDRELLVNAFWESHSLLYFKRANRWLPIIEAILKQEGVPEDFKYLAVIESDLKQVVSPAGAVGFWQFTESTGKAYGLEVNDDIDERYNVQKSTVAACKYLKKAHERFGNWTLAAASYNMGMNGIKRALQRQQVNSYYDLHLNPETSRYMFRILAVKEIMENPQKYGYEFENHELYKPPHTDSIAVRRSVSSWIDFALDHNITYKTLLHYNPWVRNDDLSNASGKTYYVQIPKFARSGKFNGYKRKTLNQDTLAAMPDTVNLSTYKPYDEDDFKRHKVSKGQDIYKIAKEYGVRVPQIMEWNNMTTSYVKRGQTLKILKRQIDE